MPVGQPHRLVQVNRTGRGGEGQRSISVRDYTPRSGADLNPFVIAVPERFFETMGVRLIAGRPLMLREEESGSTRHQKADHAHVHGNDRVNDYVHVHAEPLIRPGALKGILRGADLRGNRGMQADLPELPEWRPCSGEELEICIAARRTMSRGLFTGF